MYSIHHAGQEDVADIAKIHVACWADTYKFMPQELLDKRDISTRHTQWSREIADKNPGSQLFKVCFIDEIIGFGFAKISEDRRIPIGAGELHAGYILANHRRSAAGPLIMAAMAAHHINNGVSTLSLCVFKQNRVGITYRALGWQQVFEGDRNICGHMLPEFGMIHKDPDGLILRLENMANRNPGRRVKIKAA